MAISWNSRRFCGGILFSGLFFSFVSLPSHQLQAGDWTGYVVSSSFNEVVPIIITTNVIGSPVAVGTGPVCIAITPDAKTAYVTNSGNDSVTPIDLVTSIPGTPILVGDNPNGIAITPDGQFAYVVNRGDSTVIPITLATGVTGAAIHAGLGHGLQRIAITPDGTKAYVTHTFFDHVVAIDLATSTSSAFIPVGIDPGALAITPNGQTVYVVNTGDGIVPGTVTPIDVATNTTGLPIVVGLSPDAISITPDGTTAYVGNQGDNTVTPITLATNTPGLPIVVGSAPFGTVITPDGKTVYVTNFVDGTLSLIDVATNTVTGTTPAIAFGIADMAITPDQAPTASFTVPSMGIQSTTVTFDASLSSSPVGTIATYFWDFGDGNTQTTTSPIITHTYSEDGIYIVSLTVTNSAGTSTESTTVFTGQTMSRHGGPSAMTAQMITIHNDNPQKPHHFKGKRVGLRRHYHVCTNKLKWEASKDQTVTKYKIFRNKHQVKTISAFKPPRFLDHHRKMDKSYDYAIKACNAQGEKSKARKTHLHKFE